MAQVLSMAVPGNLGNIAGSGSDGVLIGLLTAADPTKAMLKASRSAMLCLTDDGGTYVDETTPMGEDTADDVEVLPATPAVDDAAYFGHASKPFNTISLNGTTQGDGTWTIVWEYWSGTSWDTLTVTDGTTGFTAATGWVDVTFTAPTDWERCTVDSVLGYFVRARVSAYTSVTTAPQLGQGWITLGASDWTDDTTDFTDAGAGDVALLPATDQENAVGDGFYIGYGEKFCKIKLTTSQARTGTATITLKYWNGSAWASVTTVEDDSVGYSATAGAHYIHFVPPSDWEANTTDDGPNSQAGYFVAMELTAKTDVTQQPLGTQGWVFPVVTGATGVFCPADTATIMVSRSAQTASASNANSTFLLVNITKGTAASFAWTKAVGHESSLVTLACDVNDQLALVQITEDGTTEFASANFSLQLRS